MSDYTECPGCQKRLKRLTSKPEKYRKHGSGECDYSETIIPEEALCQSGSTPDATTTIAPSAGSSPEDATGNAPRARPSIPSSRNSPAPEGSALTAGAPVVLPGVEEYSQSLNDLATAQLEAYKRGILTAVTHRPFSQPALVEFGESTLSSRPDPGPPRAPEISSFSQPSSSRKSEASAQPMTELGKELAARFKETFYSYLNRRAEDNRGAQVTMGPSEAGSPCDRRIAVSLLRLPAVNPGSDGFASFVGTCIHAGLEKMYQWADAGTGRYVTEQRLEIPSEYVPRGTADLIDRTLLLVEDFKCQGRWSRNKLRSQGPSPTYRAQAHIYAKGARLKGEKIEHVAIISIPRDEATLDDLYVWTEPYRPDIADEALARVERIGEQALAREREIREIYPDAPGDEVKARVVAEFDVADDCRFCSAYFPGAKSILDGCNGRP